MKILPKTTFSRLARCVSFLTRCELSAMRAQRDLQKVSTGDSDCQVRQDLSSDCLLKLA